jgi:hypothetical protein
MMPGQVPLGSMISNDLTRGQCLCLLLTRYHYRDHIKEEEKSGVCSTHEREGRHK